MRPVTCRELVDFLDDYLSGALAATRRELFEDHLSRCPSCVSYMNTYREAVRLGKKVLERSEDPVDEAIPEGLVRAILAAREKDSGTEG